MAEMHRAAAFFDAAYRAFTAAAAQAEVIVRRLHIAGVRVEAQYASRTLTARHAHALAHLPDFDGDPDLTVCLWETNQPGGALPALPWRFFADMYTPEYGTQGEIAGFNDGCWGALHTQWFGDLTLIDRQRRLALCSFTDAADLPYWYTAFPLRAVLHLYSRDLSLQLMHAAAVGTERGGVLIAGASGAGKSTTALSPLLPGARGGLRIAGDDYVAVSGEGETRRVHSLYSIVKLVNHPRHPFSHLQPYVINPVRRAEDKPMIALHAAAPQDLITGFPLRAIVLPRITHQRGSYIVPGRAIDALRALAPSTLFQTIAAKPVSFRKLAGLVRAVPVYTLMAGDDIAALPGLLADLLASLETA
jgi:hypothetical protein